MGTITSGEVLDRSELILIDEANDRWPRDQLRGNLNSGLRLIALYKPEAFVTTRSVQWSAGSKQVLPDGGIAVRAVPRNMGADGETPGSAITVVARQDLDVSLPGWHTVTGTEVEHIVLDPENPKIYYTYPSAAGKYGECTFIDTPPPADDDAVAISIDDLYEPLLVYCVVGAALEMSSADGIVSRADWYATRVSQGLGIQTQGQFRFSSQPARQRAQGG